jgi:hypothetical protein
MRAGALALACVLSKTTPAFADDAAPPAKNDSAPAPGQKPPCVPATSYVLGYDCELFPLPNLAGHSADTPAAAAAAGGGDVEAAATPPPSSSSSGGKSHAPAYVMFGVAAAGVGTSVAFGILALQKKSALNSECPNSSDCPQSASSNVSALKLDGILADVGAGVAVVGITVGTILFISESGHSSSSAARKVTPWLGLGAGGVRGTF